MDGIIYDSMYGIIYGSMYGIIYAFPMHLYAFLYVLDCVLCVCSMFFLGVHSPLPGRTIFRNMIGQSPFSGGSLPYRGEPFSEI